MRPPLSPLASAAALFLTLAAAGPVLASDPAASDGDREADTNRPERLDRVEVAGTRDRLLLQSPNATGSRLGLTARETPATVQTLTQEDLQFRGLRTARETFADIPGVISGNVPGNPAAVMMRGFSGNAVSVLQDGVRVSTSTVVQRDTNTWHFDRIEVIKGPASVLHGEGALAGAINKVTRQPVLDGNQFDAMLSIGSFNTRMAAGGANLQLSDAVAVRVDASQLDSDSLYDVDDNKTRSRGLTASALFKPDARLSVLVAVDHYEDRYDSTYQGVPLVPLAFARDPAGAVSSTGGLVVDKALRHRNYNPAGSYSNADETTLRSHIAWTPSDGWSWTTDLTAYRADRAYLLSDTQTFVAPTAAFPNGSFARSAQRFYHDHEFWNLRTAIARDTRLGGLRNRFTAGVEHNRTDFASLRQSAPNGVLDAVDPYTPVLGTLPGNGAAYTAGNVNFDSRLTTTSWFAENALNLTSRWLLVAGLREDRINLDRRVTNFNTTPNAVQTANPHYRPLSWRLGTTYDWRPDTTLYAQLTSAAVPVSSMLLQSIVNTSFKLTKGRSAEIGFKSTLLDRRLTWNVTAFYMDFQGFQAQSRDLITNQNVLNSIGKVTSKGVETEFSAKLGHGLSVNGGGSYNKAKMNDFPNASCFAQQTVAQGCVGGLQDLSGKPLFNAPEWNANVNALYERPIAEGYTGFVNAGFRWQSKVIFNLLQDPDSVQNDYGIFNLSGGVQTDRWKLTAFVNNLFDKSYALTKGRSAQWNVSQTTNPTTNAVNWKPARDSERYVGARFSISY
jgi:iron complex outermembrane receptor protein